MRSLIKNRFLTPSVLSVLALAVSSTTFAQDLVFPNSKFVPSGGRILLAAGQTEEGLVSYQSSFGPPAAATFYLSPSILTGLRRGDPDEVGINDVNAILGRSPNSALFVGFYWGFDFDYDLVNATRVENVPDEPFEFVSSFDSSSQSPLPCLTGRFAVDQFGETACGAELLRNIQISIAELKALNVPIFMRLGYEAEGPWNGHDPDFYKEVWRIVVGEIRRQQANNIAMVWQIAGACFPKGVDEFVYNNASSKGFRSNSLSRDQYGKTSDATTAFDRWYPGNDLVDWTGFSYFSEYDDCGAGGGQGDNTLQRAVDYLKSKGKPIMLAEAGPRGLHIQNGTFTSDPNAVGQFYRNQELANAKDISRSLGKGEGFPEREEGDPELIPVRNDANEFTLAPVSEQQMWDLWYPRFLQFVERNRNEIRAVAYINDFWESHGRWKCNPLEPRTELFVRVRNCSEGYWGDTQLGHNSLLSRLWQQNVVDNPTYLAQPSATMFSELQFFCELVPASSHCTGVAAPAVPAAVVPGTAVPAAVVPGTAVPAAVVPTAPSAVGVTEEEVRLRGDLERACSGPTDSSAACVNAIENLQSIGVTDPFAAAATTTPVATPATTTTTTIPVATPATTTTTTIPVATPATTTTTAIPVATPAAGVTEEEVRLRGDLERACSGPNDSSVACANAVENLRSIGVTSPFGSASVATTPATITAAVTTTPATTTTAAVATAPTTTTTAAVATAPATTTTAAVVTAPATTTTVAAPAVTTTTTAAGMTEEEVRLRGDLERACSGPNDSSAACANAVENLRSIGVTGPFGSASVAGTTVATPAATAIPAATATPATTTIPATTTTTTPAATATPATTAAAGVTEEEVRLRGDLERACSGPNDSSVACANAVENLRSIGVTDLF